MKTTIFFSIVLQLSDLMFFLKAIIGKKVIAIRLWSVTHLPHKLQPGPRTVLGYNSLLISLQFLSDSADKIPCTLVSSLDAFLKDTTYGSQWHRKDKMPFVVHFLQIVCIYSTMPVVSDYHLGQFAQPSGMSWKLLAMIQPPKLEHIQQRQKAYEQIVGMCQSK